MTTTLRIEHAITGFDAWLEAFDRFADARRTAGVLRHRIFRPVDDPHFVTIDLDFDSVDAAVGFRDFLTTRIWAIPDNAPALLGTPSTTLLDGVSS